MPDKLGQTESIDYKKSSNYNNIEGNTRTLRSTLKSEEFKKITNTNIFELKNDKIFLSNLAKFNKDYNTAFDISMIAHLKTFFSNGTDIKDKVMEDSLKKQKHIYEQLEKELFSKEKEKNFLLISIVAKKLDQSKDLNSVATGRRSTLDSEEMKEVEKKIEKFNKEHKTDLNFVSYSYLQAFFSRPDFAQAANDGPNRLQLPTETITTLKTIYPEFKNLSKGLPGHHQIQETEKLLEKSKTKKKEQEKEKTAKEVAKTKTEENLDEFDDIENFEDNLAVTETVKINEDYKKGKKGDVGKFMKNSGKTGIELNNKFVGKKTEKGIENKKKKTSTSKEKAVDSSSFYGSSGENKESNNTFEGQEILENIYETVGLPMTVNGFIKNIEQKSGPYKETLNLNIEKRNIDSDGSFSQRFQIDKINNIRGNIKIDKNGLLKMTNPFSRDTKNFAFSETSTVKMHALSEFEELLDEKFLLELANQTLEEGKNIEAGEKFQNFFKTKFQEKLQTAITEKINDMTDPTKLSEQETQKQLEKHLNKLNTGSRLLTFFKPQEKAKKYFSLGETIDQEKNPGLYKYLGLLKNTIELNNEQGKQNLNYTFLESFERLKIFQETNKNRLNSYQGGLPHRYKEILEFFNGKDNKQPDEEKFLKFIDAFSEGKDETKKTINIGKLEKFASAVEKNEPLKETDTTDGFKSLLEETKQEKEKKEKQATAEAHEKTEAELDLALKTIV